MDPDVEERNARSLLSEIGRVWPGLVHGIFVQQLYNTGKCLAAKMSSEGVNGD